jgi:pimeloyl-ACP methyl ester carboxylesterase
MDHRYMVSDLEPLFSKRDGWRRLYPDLPGHGMTRGKDWMANRDQELDIVPDFIDAVIPEESFVLAGSSAGAYMARGVV